MENYVFTKFFRTTQRLAPGRIYSEECDGITRFQPTGLITEVRTSIIAVTTTERRNVRERREIKGPANYFNKSIVEPLERPMAPSCEIPSTVCEGLPNMDFITGRACRSKGDCQLNVGGDELVLLYWPQNDVSRDICEANPCQPLSKTESHLEQGPPKTFVTTAISFRGQDLEWISYAAYGETFQARLSRKINATSSVLYGQFTFTSPTVYLAHRPIQAEYWTTTSMWDLSYGAGNYYSTTPILIRPAGVTALGSNDLFSVRPLHCNSNVQQGSLYAQLVAKGLFDPNPSRSQGRYPNSPQPWHRNQCGSTVCPFDFRHLGDPVPASVYFDARHEDCWGNQTHCGTITDNDYRPSLSLGSSFFEKMVPSSLLPNNKWSCTLPNLVDPPIVLSHIGPPYTEPDPNLQYSNAHSTIRDPGSNPQNGHTHVELDAYGPGSQSRARPGNSIAPPFPSTTRKPGADCHNSEKPRGFGCPGSSLVGNFGKNGKPVRWTGEAGSRQGFSNKLIFAWAVGVASVYCYA